MSDNLKYRPDDLVAVVWPRQAEPLIRAGQLSWQEAARGGWAMDPGKAERVTVLIAVFDDVVKASWAVTGVEHQAETPEGKSRTVSRSWFQTADDPRLAYLFGAPSPLSRRRNPQSTLELRDLPGADMLLADAPPPVHGVVHIGGFTLLVGPDGATAEVRIPAGASVTVRTAGTDA